MSDIFKFRSRSDIDEEAAAWIWRMESDTVSAASHDAFNSWLRRDSRHRRAYDELTHVWAGLDGLSEAKREEKIAMFTQSSAGFRLNARHRWWSAAAAAIVAAVAIAAWMRTGGEVQTLAAMA